MHTILICDDDRDIVSALDIYLASEGYRTLKAYNGLEAIQAVERNEVHLILMDIMMPELDGIRATARLREGSNIPIILLTAKSEDADKILGLNIGADDYMTKPVDEEEMILRIRALLRRAQIVNERRITIGDVCLDYDSLTVSRGNESQTLPRKEFYLLYKLLSYPGKIFTRIQLMDEIWGMESQSDDNTINVHINRLRKRFEDYPEFTIETIRGLGYKAVKNI